VLWPQNSVGTEFGHAIGPGLIETKTNAEMNRPGKPEDIAGARRVPRVRPIRLRQRPWTAIISHIVPMFWPANHPSPRLSLCAIRSR
jgi:hypothetical protein